MRVDNLKDLFGKEAYEVKFIWFGEELKGYKESYIITNTENDMIRVLNADDPYRDVVNCLDIKGYQDKLNNSEIRCILSEEETLKGREVVDKLNGL